MTSPIVEYVATAGQTDFDVPFPFLSSTHVEVRANGIRYYPKEWVNPTRLRLDTPLPAGSLVTISRNTPIDLQIVQFQNGAVLTQEDLNMAVQQILYKQQELVGLYEGTLYKARVRIGEAGGVTVTPEDAANQIASLVAADQVLADFRARVSDIQLNAETIISRTLQYQETRERVMADIRQERIIRMAEDEALASRIDTVFAAVGDNAAAILQEATARATAISAEATLREQLAITVGDLEGAIQNEATIRATQDGVFTNLFTLLGAKNAAGTAFVLNDSSVQLSNGVALATRLSGIDTAIGNTSAAIVNEQNARAAGDQANANAISTVSSTVNGHTSSISTLSSSVNGLLSRWGIQLNSNGYISGIVMNNSGSSSDFTVLVDKFRIINGANGNYLYPFVVEDGVVKVKALLAGTISADLITTGTLRVDRLEWGQLDTRYLKDFATTDVGVYFANLNGSRPMGTKYVYRDLQNLTTLEAVQATVNANGATNARAVIDFTWVASRDGGDDDDLALRIIRSDGLILPQQLHNVQIDGGKRTYAAKFYDSAVPPTGNVTYKVQFTSLGDGWSYWYNVALVVTLHKK